MTDTVVAAVGETSVEVVLPAAQAVCSCPAPVGRGSLGWMPFAARRAAISPMTARFGRLPATPTQAAGRPDRLDFGSDWRRR